MGFFFCFLDIYIKIGYMKQSLLENIIIEELNKTDIIDIARKDKDFEKRIKEIVSDVVVELFRVLWQHSSTFKSLVK